MPSLTRAPRTLRFRRPAAVLTALALALGTVLGLAPAFPAAAADGPTLGATPAPIAGGTVTVTGSGFSTTDPGIYLGVGPVGLAGFYAGSSQLTDIVWVAVGNASANTSDGRTEPMDGDGGFSLQVTVPAHSDGAQYAIYTSKAHGLGAYADFTQNAVQAIAWAAPTATTTTLALDPAGSAVAGASVTLTATVAPAAVGSVEFFDGATSLGSATVAGGVATTATTVLAAGDHSVTATFAPTDPTAFAASASTAVSYTVTTPTGPVEPAAPTLTVSKTAGLDPDGETVTITGTNYRTDFHPGYSPSSRAGVYVEVGYLASTWRPSDGAPATSRTNAAALAIGDHATGGAYVQWTDNGDGTADFVGTLTLDQATLRAKALAGGSLAIFTVGSGGTTQAVNELAVPITFAADPQLSVSQTSGLNALGDTITITGTDYGTDFHPGYAPATRAGVYVEVGYLAPTWRPSDGAPSSSRTNAYALAIGDHATGGQYVQWTDNGDGTADFVATLTIDQATLDAKPLDGGSLAVFTVGSGGTTQAVNELAVPIAFGASTTPPTGGDGGDGTGTGTGGSGDEPASTPSASGALVWGIKASFRDYITGPIAAGSVTLSGASTSGGAYVFPQSSTGGLDPTTDAGTVAYSGSVRFLGHGGALDVKLADPIITVTSPSTATISVAGYSGRIVFANLALASGTRTDSGGAVTFSGVPATLTAAGAALFQGNYPAGTALDPVTFTVGAVASAPTGGAKTVAAYVAPATHDPAPTPPATDGIEIGSDALTPGQSISVSATGFQPGETGILLVVYSTPRVLADDLVADGSGTVRWSGALPADLVGEHTLTFQGSVNRGVVVTIADAVSPGACLVDGATLDWGFKESFRSYIKSSIANGDWTLADGATYTTPQFGWSAGTGSYDPETHQGLVRFTGSVRFTGHDGALDVTIANPELQFVDATTAYLLLDVTGTNDQGQAISGTTQFATLTLSGDELADGALTGDAIAATLTADGHTAFPDYAAGDALDPVTFSVTLPSDCGVATPTPTPEPTMEASSVGGSAPAAASPWGWIIAGIVVLLIIVAAIVWLAVRRRRGEA